MKAGVSNKGGFEKNGIAARHIGWRRQGGEDEWGNSFEKMSDEVFFRLGGFIQNKMGIKMPLIKKAMLQARLQRRLRELGLGSYAEYSDYLFSNKGMEEEVAHVINVVTTNKTDFFREPGHFDLLLNEVIPEIVKYGFPNARPNVNLWSAACSTGEEPYTLAMVLSEYAEKYPGFRFSILGTDISPKALEKARTGIYEEDRVEVIPLSLRRKYLLRGKDQNKGLVRIVPELRSRVRFSRINLVEDSYGIRESMNIIFCRNVLIYFDRATQEKVLHSLVGHLQPGGYLFMGHSETLNSFNLPLETHVLTVYRKIREEGLQ